jgi:hypothetical protein
MENMNLMDVLNILAGTSKKDAQEEKTKETPETETKTGGKDELLNEIVEMDFEMIQKGELTYDEAIAEFKKCNGFVCKIIFGWLITPKEEELLNMKYAEELKKLLDKANEDSKTEETPKGEAEVELDFYINQCAVKSLAFMAVQGDGRLAAAMASGYTAALIDAGILKDAKEAQREFVNAVAKKAGI